MRGRVTLGLLLVLWIVVPNPASGFPDGVPDGYAGAPPSMNTCIACHDSYPLNSGIGGVLVGGFSTSYTPSDSIDFQVIMGHTGFDHWGYQLTILDEDNESAGIFLLQDSLSVLSEHHVPQPDYLSQSQAGVLSGEPFGLWEALWLSPPIGTGPVTVYLTGMAADGDGTPAGDYVYTHTFPMQEGNGGVTGPWPVMERFHDYQLVPVNTERDWMHRVYNIGTDPWQVSDFLWLNGDYFSVIEPALPLTVPTGDWVDVTIRFAPEITGNWGDSLSFADNNPNITPSVHVTGRGTLPLPPEEFHLVSPQDGLHVSGDSLRFAWTPSSNPDSTDTTVIFDLEIDTESDFQTSILYEAGSDTTIALPLEEFADDELYFWRVHARDTNTPGTYSEEECVFITDFTGVNENGPSVHPDDPFLLDTYPNPFNDRLTVTFELPHPVSVAVEVIDVAGRRVSVLHSGPMAAGRHRLQWTARTASGLYLVRVSTPGRSPILRKVVLVK